MPKLVLKDWPSDEAAFIRYARKEGYTESEIRAVLESGNYLITLNDRYEAFLAGFNAATHPRPSRKKINRTQRSWPGAD